jgi:hypothetical protein
VQGLRNKKIKNKNIQKTFWDKNPVTLERGTGGVVHL